MIVKLIAHTWLDVAAIEDLYEPHRDSDGIRIAFDADELAEFSGRGCYRSFNRPNAATATSETYLGHIQQVEHESVLEHATASFYLDEVSRSLLAELTRHRHLSFSVVSQRYVDPQPLGYIVPPIASIYGPEVEAEVKEILADAWSFSNETYEALLEIFADNGAPRKQAREAARAVMPNMTNSPMVVSGNHRAWRWVIQKRWHSAADAEIRAMAGEMLRQLRDIAPNTYQDIPDEPY